MPRFKQPLLGLSRLSDEIGGGASLGPEISATGFIAAASITVPALVAGDILVIFSRRASGTLPGTITGGISGALTTLQSAVSSGSISSIIVATLSVGSPVASQTFTSSSAGGMFYAIVRNSSGVGGTSIDQGGNEANVFYIPITGKLDSSLVILGNGSAGVLLVRTAAVASAAIVYGVLNSALISSVGRSSDAFSAIFTNPLSASGGRSSIAVELLA